MGAIVSVAEVRDWAKRPQTAPAVVELVRDAAEATLRRTHVVPDGTDAYDDAEDPPAEPVNPAPPDLRLALLMQCARLLTRPDSPNGVIPGFESGALRIGRFDPDIDALIPLPRKPALA